MKEYQICSYAPLERILGLLWDIPVSKPNTLLQQNTTTFNAKRIFQGPKTNFLHT